jgi:3-isopropylmalate dehydrogenase
VLSAAMLLRLSLGREDVAAAIEGAVRRALDEGFRTADLMPPASDAAGVERVGTAGMTTAIVERIGIPRVAPDAPVAASLSS